MPTQTATIPTNYMGWSASFAGKQVIITLADGTLTCGTFLDVVTYVSQSWAVETDDGRVQYINPAYVVKIIPMMAV